MRILNDGEVVAIMQRKGEWSQGLDFLTPAEAFCQVGTWWYPAGKVLRAHRHQHHERVVTVTQECVVVMNGSVRVDLYDKDKRIFRKEVLEAGDFMVILGAGHGYEILEPDTRVIECKNGPFVSVEKDKEFLA